MKGIQNIIHLLLFSLVLLFAACAKTGETTASIESDTTATEVVAQKETPKEEIPSPLKKVSGEIAGVQVNMQYGSPGVKERDIWGSLVPYGEVWRIGANEATWIEFNKDVSITEQNIPAGKYGFFTIPNEGEWTVILNKVWDQWGAYDYNEAEDVIRFTVKTENLDTTHERMNFAINDKVNFMWENLGFSFDIAAATAQ
ncbi:MAG: DUF2911 domain-containing protein [Bacteroidota bacterium]